MRKVLKSFQYDKEKMSLSYKLVELNLKGKNKFYAFCGPLAKSHTGFYPLWNMPDKQYEQSIIEVAKLPETLEIKQLKLKMENLMLTVQRKKENIETKLELPYLLEKKQNAIKEYNFAKKIYEQEMDKHIKNEPGYIKYNLNYKAKKL